jgi:hypothetical protein
MPSEAVATDLFGRCGQPDLAPNRRESVVGLSLPVPSPGSS